jgi:fatty acid desaturase
MTFPTKKHQIAYTKRFREMFEKNSSFEALSIVAAHLVATVAVTAICVTAFFYTPAAGFALYPLSVWLIGTRYRAFINTVHECVHSSFAKSLAVNVFIGEFLCTLLFISFADYKHHHATHHVHTGNYEKDLDFINSKHYDFHIPLNRELILRHIRRIFTGAVFKDYIGDVLYDPKASTAWRIIRTLYLLLLILLVTTEFFVFGTFIVALFVLVPRFVALPLIGYISDFLDHGGVLGQEHDLNKSRNYIVRNRLLLVVFFPRNDCYHLLHHLFPTVPTRFFPQVHRILMEEQPEYRVKPHTFRQWLREPFTTTTPVMTEVL